MICTYNTVTDMGCCSRASEMKALFPLIIDLFSAPREKF